jgi:chromosome segregation ATPase
MPSADDILLDRMIASLREVQNLKDKPRELRAEIASLKAERDTARAELERIRKELKDPSLNKERHEQAQKIRREIEDKQRELELLTERVAKQRVQLDELQALCKQQLDHHDQLLASIDSLRKRVGLAADTRPTFNEPSGVTLTPEERTWDYIQAHTKKLEERKANGAQQPVQQ